MLVLSRFGATPLLKEICAKNVWTSWDCTDKLYIIVADVGDIARYLIKLASEEPEDEPLTHMRLHKLLYYVQGWVLALDGRVLFSDSIEAWTHGPVVYSVYKHFQKYGRLIPPEEGDEPEALSAADRQAVQSVWGHYKRFSATQLRTMTHAEDPWRKARGGLGPDEPSDRPISRDEMLRWFRAEYERTAIEGTSFASLSAADQDIREGRVTRLQQIARA